MSGLPFCDMISYSANVTSVNGLLSDAEAADLYAAFEAVMAQVSQVLPRPNMAVFRRTRFLLSPTFAATDVPATLRPRPTAATATPCGRVTTAATPTSDGCVPSPLPGAVRTAAVVRDLL